MKLSVNDRTLPRIVNALREHGTPSPEATMATLRRVGGELGLDHCYALHRSYHFVIGSGWTIAIKPEAAGRFRVDRCKSARPASSLWTHDGDDERLAGLVRSHLSEIRAWLEAHNFPGGDAHDAGPRRLRTRAALPSP